MKTTNDIQKEALAAQQEDASLQEQDYEISKVLQYLAPWIEKNNGEESVGSWETTLATRMMLKLLGLWLTDNSRKRIEKMLEGFHPLDRSAMAYALVVYAMTGRKMYFKSAVVQQHYKIVCKMLKEDMPELMFTGHMRYMLRRYGKKSSKKQ